jgi:hypothetical protein
MTDKEILIKALEKAVTGGYKDKVYNLKDYKSEDYYIEDDNYIYAKDWSGDSERTSVKDIIFSHEFAKAFWGEEEVCNICGSLIKRKINENGMEYLEYSNDCCFYHRRENWNHFELILKWQYHLQQMVLYEEPLKYLKTFLDNI